MLLGEKEARTLCERVLESVRADDAEVVVQNEDYSQLRFAANNLTTNGRREDLDVTVTVWIDGKKGSASNNETDDASLVKVVRQAESVARISPVDPEYLPTLGAQKYKPVGGFVEATVSADPVARAKTIHGIIASCEKAGVTGAGFHQARGLVEAAASKHGNFRHYRRSLASLSLTARAAEGGGSGYFLRNHFDVSRLDTERIAREAIQKALGSRQPKALDPGTYTVILEPQAIADLLGRVTSFFDARTADEGRSPFSAPGGKTRLSERVFDERLSLYSDPWHPELPGPPYAQDGIPAEKLYLVREGVLENLVYTRFWAKKKDKPATPGPVNVILEGSGPAASIEEMIKDTRRGLLVSRFWYIRMVDPRSLALTGLTRDGVWLIEDGKIRHPVRNFRFNQSILKMLAPGNPVMVGAPERVGSSEAQGSSAALLPALKVKEFNFTSASEAV
jgi:predicted Zn-dependent protease